MKVSGSTLCCAAGLAGAAAGASFAKVGHFSFCACAGIANESASATIRNGSSRAPLLSAAAAVDGGAVGG